MSEYLRFRAAGASASYKTEVWEVETAASGTVLGEIRWFGRWRQYAFFPSAETVYNPDCLDSISAHTRWLTKRHREEARLIRIAAASKEQT